MLRKVPLGMVWEWKATVVWALVWGLKYCLWLLLLMLRIKPFLKRIFSIPRGFSDVNLGMLEGEFDTLRQVDLALADVVFFSVRRGDFRFGLC